MKFLYLQDFHISGRNSIYRKDNYFESILSKLDEIFSLAKEYQCDAIFDNGDFFDTENPSYRILDEVADRFEKAKIPMYSLFGNHCLNKGHVENSKYVGLSHLQKRSKYFRPMQDLIANLDDLDVELIPIDYEFGIEEKLKNEGIIFQSKNKWNIAIIHALITPKKFIDSVNHLTVKQCKTNGDLILIGHWHQPYEIKVKETTFLNIGCLGRKSITEKDIKPSVLILDTEKRSYEIIKLKSAKKGEDCFDLEAYGDKRETKKDITEFIEKLQNTEFQSMSIGDQIAKIGKENEVEKTVVDYLLTKKSEAENE